MNRVRISVAILLVAVTAVAVALGIRSGRSDVSPQRDAIVGATQLSASGALFGDQIHAQIRVLVDARQVDPSRVTFHATYGSYSLAGPPEVSTRNVGRLARLVYSARLVCFTQKCVPPLGSSMRVQFPPAQISYSTRTGGRSRTLRWGWRPLTVAPRTSADDFTGFSTFEGPPSRATLDPTKATYSMSPHLLRLILFVASGLLAVAAIAVLGRFVLTGRVSRRALLSPLERAVVLVERATARSDFTERRKALARLSEELARTGEHDLSHVARELAWAERAPVPAASEPLTLDVRRVIEQRSNGYGR